MSQVRDNVGVSGGTVPNFPTDSNAAETQAAQEAQLQGPSDAQLALRHERREKDAQTKAQDFQSDFIKKIGDPPGYGANEDGDAQKLKAGMAANNLPVPSGQQVQSAHNAIGQTKEFDTAVQTVKGALDGEAPVPSPEQMHALLSKVGAADTTGNLAVAPQPGSAAATSTAMANTMTKTVAGTASQSADNPSGLPVTTSISALVFLVTLASQRETVKEKNDVLRKIKMFNGMLDQVNKLVNSQLIPAQKQMADMREAGKDKRNFKPENIQVPVNWPSNIDTDNASMNAETGEVVLNAQWGDGKGGPSRRLVNSTDLNTLIGQADQVRTSIQNNQTQQSNRFQSKDNQMSSAWNILNAVLKNTHEGVTSTVKNI